MRRRKMKQMETLMSLANSNTRQEFSYTGLKHSKNFIGVVKPHRALFSTYEPLNSYEARYNAAQKIIQEQEDEVNESKSPSKTEVPSGYRFDPAQFQNCQQNMNDIYSDSASSCSPDKFRSTLNKLSVLQSESDSKKNPLQIDLQPNNSLERPIVKAK